MATSTVWGLDIGNAAIKAVKMTREGTRDNPSCKIEDFDIIEVPQGEDEKDRAARLQTALMTLTSNHAFGRDPVYVSLAGNICLHREFQLPPGCDDKMAELVQYEAKQQIPFPLDQVEWGYERYDDANGIGVALIAVRKNDIQELLNILKTQCNLNIKGIVASPMALFNFIQYEFNPQQTTLILDAGSKGTDFVVMNKRQIYFRTIQIAGREITRSLENKFKVPYEKAEDLKKNITQSQQKEKILQVIEPTLRQLGAEIQRTIGFYKSKVRGQRIGQCYLLGHTFRLPGMAESLQAQVREAPFALVEGLQRVKIDHSCNAEVWNNEFPTMTVAIGLGIQGLGLSELKLNLLPRDLAEEGKEASIKIWSSAAAAVVLVSLGFGYWFEGRQHAKYETKLAELTKIENEAKQFDTKEKQLTAHLPKRREVLERFSRIARDKGRLTEILSKITAQQLFGEKNKIFITNFYASRIPLGTQLQGEQLTDIARAEMLKDSQNLKGKDSVYGFLAKGPDPLSRPSELRPDAPLIVVLTCEIEGDDNDARKRIDQIKNTFELNPEIKDCRITDSKLSNITHIETPLQYHFETGKLSTGTPPPTPPTPTPAVAPKVPKYSTVHVIFRWVDTSDPDIDPETAALAVAASEGAAKK